MTARRVIFERFIDQLACMETPPHLFNQYAYGNEDNGIRRQNLLVYLNQLDELQPRLMLVGEAPGYRGSRLTGVPFTSEHLLMHNREGLSLFGKQNGYQLPHEEKRLLKEATATIIWDTLLKCDLSAVGWNAVPFHPHKPDNEKSNRTPNKVEVLLGEAPLLGMLDMFPIEKVVAVGNKAAASLEKLGLEYQKVRHPAQGGKALFVQGMMQVKEELG